MALALILLKVRAPNLDDLLQPGPEPGAGGPDLVPRQLLEAELDAGLQLGHGFACSSADVSLDRAKRFH